MIALGRVGLEYNLKNHFFFRVFAQVAATAYAIRTAFFFAYFFGVNHIQRLVNEAQQDIVAQVILASATVEEQDGSHRGFLLLGKLILVLSLADVQLVVLEGFFPVDGWQGTQVLSNLRFHLFQVDVTYEVESEIACVFVAVFIHLDNLVVVNLVYHVLFHSDGTRVIGIHGTCNRIAERSHRVGIRILEFGFQAILV